MLLSTPTKKGAGLSIWGDELDLKSAYRAIEILASSPVANSINRDLLMGLAREFRKAYEGSRDSRQFGTFDPVTYKGMKILWTSFLPVLPILRYLAGFMKSTREVQSVLYALEDCAADAIREADPRVLAQCESWMDRAHFWAHDYNYEFLDWQAKRFIVRHKTLKSRMTNLPKFLQSLHWSSDDYKTFTAVWNAHADSMSVPPQQIQDLSPWPDFQW